jgi:hypothetical protein
MKENDHLKIPELPIQIGDSDQFVSGFIALDRPMELVQIIVKDVRRGQEWRVGPVPVPAPVDAFVEALNHWRASQVYPSRPKVRTRTLEANELEPYCLRYRQAYELMDDGPALKAFRTQLWTEWRQAQTEAGKFPAERGQKEPRRAIRKNFADALDAYLAEWKADKETEPYNRE